jgi:hypothetical protein
MARLRREHLELVHAQMELDAAKKEEAAESQARLSTVHVLSESPLHWSRTSRIALVSPTMTAKIRVTSMAIFGTTAVTWRKIDDVVSDSNYLGSVGGLSMFR